MKKSEASALGLVAVVALPIYGVSVLFESIGLVIPIAIIGIIIIAVVWYQYDKKQKRLTYLKQKYQDDELVRNIVNGYFWQGQSEGQLTDSLGSPVAIDEKILKTKTKEIWKYNHQGGNRYSLRITVENGYVVGWDQKA